MNAPMTPDRVLPRQPNHRHPNHPRGRRSTIRRRPNSRVRPARATGSRCQRRHPWPPGYGARRTTRANTARAITYTIGNNTQRSCRTPSEPEPRLLSPAGLEMGPAGLEMVRKRGSGSARSCPSRTQPHAQQCIRRAFVGRKPTLMALLRASVVQNEMARLRLLSEMMGGQDVLMQPRVPRRLLIRGRATSCRELSLPDSLIGAWNRRNPRQVIPGGGSEWSGVTAS
jgi:hypothetical protein